MVFGDLESLVKTHIHAEVAGASQGVASTDFSWKILTVGTGGDCRTTKQADRPVRVPEHPSLGCRRDFRGVTTQFPVGSPSCTIADAERKTTGPAEETRELPSAQGSIDHAASVRPKSPAMSERKLHNPVRVELVCGIERGN